MALSLPYPTVPENGQILDATPILANILALAEAIEAFDGSQITAGSIIAAAMNANINPNTLLNETTFPFVASGLVWSGDSYASTLNGSMSAGVIYYNGIRVIVNAVVAHAFTASKDTYIDVDVNGNVTYLEVTTNAASPALTANSIRVAIVVSGTGSIAAVGSINQGQENKLLPIASSVPYAVTDSIGNLICPHDPQRRLLGSRLITGNFTTATAGSQVDITGLTAVPVIIPTGRRVYAVVTANEIKSSESAGNGIYIYAVDVTASANIGNSHTDEPVTTYTANGSFTSTPYTPSASGLRTFKLQGKQDAAGTLTVVASATNPVCLSIYMI